VKKIKRKMIAKRIIYSDKGIASRFGNSIVLNKKLKQKKYKKLHDEIIEHELGHTSNGFSWHDFKHDLNWVQHKKLYWKFILTTPKSWFQFSPIYYHFGEPYVDLSLILYWLFIISLTILWWVILF